LAARGARTAVGASGDRLYQENPTEISVSAMGNKEKIKAVAYIRTSSAANVGNDKDSERRQRAAIEAFAKRSGFALVGEFSDPGVSGADPIETRPGFAALLDRIESNGVRVVICEDASRFARELVTQELGIIALIRRGVRVVTATGDDLTDNTDPSRKMMRQIAGSFAEYEKARLVAKLRGARERKRAASGKCEGRKSWAEINPELVRQAKRLRRRSPKGHQRSLRDVASELAKLGFLNERGKPFSASSIGPRFRECLQARA
jgi:DNA invertase Pin-like site-specific DNA recombinase